MKFNHTLSYKFKYNTNEIVKEQPLACDKWLKYPRSIWQWLLKMKQVFASIWHTKTKRTVAGLSVC